MVIYQKDIRSQTERTPTGPIWDTSNININNESKGLELIAWDKKPWFHTDKHLTKWTFDQEQGIYLLSKYLQRENYKGKKQYNFIVKSPGKCHRRKWSHWASAMMGHTGIPPNMMDAMRTVSLPWYSCQRCTTGIISWGNMRQTPSNWGTFYKITGLESSKVSRSRK